MLLAGKHHRGIGMKGTRQTIEAGQIFIASSDKEAAFCRKYPDRYQEVRSEEYPVVKANVTPVGANSTETIEIDMEALAKMSVIQLLNFAKQNDIDLKGATNKDGILKAIRAAAE